MAGNIASLKQSDWGSVSIFQKEFQKNMSTNNLEDPHTKTKKINNKVKYII